VSHPSSGLRTPLTRRSLVGRAVVAGSAAAVAVLTTLSAAQEPAPATAPTAPVSAATVPVSTPVVPLAVTRPATVGFDVAAVKAAVPAAVRTAAMQKALGKIGSPYRYGAAGPHAFDCSGLVSWAFKNSGKSLPRSSNAMSRVGTPVSKSALQPGDLVFFYRPVSHVAIYIGNGKVVHASTSSSPVKISDMNRMPFNSARRV
jgi:peptidoglycan DL-endopeptidase CwlO